MNKPKYYISFEELMKGAKPTDLFKKAQEKTLKGVNSKEFKKQELERVQETAFLMDQVVGAEKW